MNDNKQPPLPFGAKFSGDGIWCQLLNRTAHRRQRPALFLDRDGVIVEEVHYLSRPEDVQLVEGAAQVIAMANALQIPVIVVTNQAGVGYGKFGWPDFIKVQEVMLEHLDQHNAYINAVFACPFHENARPPYQQIDHPSRKPNPGMLEHAEQYFAIDKTASCIIGDRANDLLAGLRYGLKMGIHVQSGHGHSQAEQQEALALDSANFQAVSINSIADSYAIIERLQGNHKNGDKSTSSDS